MDDYVLPDGEVISRDPVTAAVSGIYEHTDNVSKLLEVPEELRDGGWASVLADETMRIHIGLSDYIPDNNFVWNSVIPLLVRSVHALERLDCQDEYAKHIHSDVSYIKFRIHTAVRYVDEEEYFVADPTDKDGIEESFEKLAALA